MHTHQTRDKTIAIHHNGDWSGDVTIVADAQPGLKRQPREVTLPARDVLTGDYERPTDCQLTERELRRATALAVFLSVYHQAIEAAEGISSRGVL